jgi:propionyl-CoA carboxylase alpha chain
VAIIEAMKMENILRAPQDGVVQEIFAKKGETLAKEQRILLLGTAT